MFYTKVGLFYERIMKMPYKKYDFPRDIDNAWDEFNIRFKSLELDDTWCYWFSGLVDGEGSFSWTLDKRRDGVYPRFSINLTNDDEIMKQIKIVFKFGKLNPLRQGQKQHDGLKGNLRIAWDVTDKLGLSIIVSFFEHFPLHSKKHEEFKVWKRMVERYVMFGYRDPEIRKLAFGLGGLNNIRKGQSIHGMDHLKDLDDPI
jgi:hypothetical protein